MMNFLKRRWVVALLAIAAAYLVYVYVWPKISGKKSAPAGNPPATTAPATASTTAKLAGPVYN